MNVEDNAKSQHLHFPIGIKQQLLLHHTMIVEETLKRSWYARAFPLFY